MYIVYLNIHESTCTMIDFEKRWFFLNHQKLQKLVWLRNFCQNDENFILKYWPLASATNLLRQIARSEISADTSNSRKCFLYNSFFNPVYVILHIFDKKFVKVTVLLQTLPEILKQEIPSHLNNISSNQLFSCKNFVKSTDRLLIYSTYFHEIFTSARE